MQQSSTRGQSAQWTVTAWATGGNLTGVTLRLSAAPSGTGPARFTFGCGSSDGSSTCALGTVDAAATPRQLKAEISIPLSAATSKPVTLTASSSATGLSAGPVAAAAVSVTAQPSATASPTPTATAAGTARATATSTAAPTMSATGPATAAGTSSQAAYLQGVTAQGITPALTPSISPGGNAASLFPALSPQASAPGPAGTPGPGVATGAGGTTGASGTTGALRAVPAANTVALPGATSTRWAQVAALSVLALACLFSVARTSIRRRIPATATAGLPQASSQPAGDPADSSKAADAGADAEAGVDAEATADAEADTDTEAGDTAGTETSGTSPDEDSTG